MRLQLHGAYAGGGGPGYFFETHPTHLQHADDLALAGGQNCDERIEIREGEGSGAFVGFRKREHGLLTQTNSLRAAVAVDSYMASDSVKPWQHRLARPVGVAGFVNLQPGVLKESLGSGGGFCLAP